MTAAERGILLPPPRPSILEYSRQHFHLSAKTSRIHGAWNDDYTPYMRRPLELLSRPPVRVWISAARQSGKSTMTGILENYIFAADPDPTGIVLPQEGIARDRIRTKLRPMFESNPVLMDKLRGDVRNLNIGEPTDLGDMLLFLCWSSSITTLSDRTIRNMIYDEVALFVTTDIGENPVEAGRDRQETYKSIARELGVSSAGNEGDIHDRQMRAGTDEWSHVPCPKRGCGRWHRLRTYVDESDEKYIVLDRPRPGAYYPSAEYIHNAALSRYVCPHCGKAWSESDRWEANRNMRYVSCRKPVDADGNPGPPAQTMDENGRITGEIPEGIQYSFTWHAMMIWPGFTTVGDIAGFFVKARNNKDRGDLSEMKKWVRSYQAAPWKEVARTVSAEALTEKVTDRKSGTVPVWCRLLTCGADYHQDTQGNVRVEYMVTGWGEDLKSAVIETGYAVSLDELFLKTCRESYPWDRPEKDSPPELMVSCGFADAGYQPNDPYEGVIDVVYDFCLRYAGRGIWWPCMGGKPNVQVLKYSDLEEILRRAQQRYRRKYAGQYRGMKLVTVDVSYFKDRIADWSTAPVGASASMEFPEGLEPSFWRSFCNEHKVRDEKGRWSWQPRDGRAASESHKLDTCVYAAAAAWHKQIYKLFSAEAMAGPSAAMGDRIKSVPAERIVRRTGRAIRTRY